MPPKFLSKSRYIDGLQCLKYLWTEFHEPDKVSEPDSRIKECLEIDSRGIQRGVADKPRSWRD